jgi:5'-3' exonuclease
MGIPFYYVSLIKKHKGSVSRVKVKLEPDVLAIDFNCLIHNYIDDTRPIESVVEALDTICLTICSPRKYLYIAMDGIVPYAKIVQQRYRRFKNKTETSVFDRNQISPGTPYMKDLTNALREKFPTAIISSTTDDAGEGEHKIFQWLKVLPKEHRRSVCIYGLDADLILLSLAQCETLALPRSFWLLRENQTFGDKETPGFSILNIGALGIDLPIRQYMMLSIMCFGNDFVPPIGLFSLREGGYERAIHMYNLAGRPDLCTADGRRTFLKVAGKQEFNFYREKVSKRGCSFERAVVVPDARWFEQRYNLHVQDGVQDTAKVVEAYWKIVHWTYEYFTQNNVQDWSFYYAYPEAPLISQILQYSEPDIAWQETPKYTLTKHLQFILPSKSLHLAKKLCVHPDEVYTEERHPWLRKYDWEAEPRISLPSEDLTTVQPCLF